MTLEITSRQFKLKAPITEDIGGSSAEKINH